MSNRAALAIAGLLTGMGLLSGCDRAPTLAPTPTTLMSAPPPVDMTVLSVTSATPPAGLPGAIVSILGTGFSTGTAVFLDGVQVRAFPASSGLLVVVPPHPSGVVEVTLTDEKGQRATLPGGFTYQSMTLWAGVSAVSPGGALTVNWDAPVGRDPFDWVGLFRVGDPNNTYEQLWWSYTNGGPTGSKTLAAPMSPGEYEFRYFVEDGLIDAARSNGVVVTGSGG